ncbi:uncharacterized protein [Musca autumnalis]|uniref:uncharacterized protein n=1 Tax=Musca autumnalis TaxID=221902 RepID=UPI003CF5E693
MLQLQYEISELEAKREKAKTSTCFADVDNALTKFNGDDGYDVTKWIKEFEKVTSVIGCTEAEQFLFARRMMTGSASVFMRSSEANTWVKFKKELAAEFKQVTGIKEALKRLEDRKWNKQTESLHRYALLMQELAEGTPISEAELVEFIVEGIQDKTMAATVFVNITTVNDFKRAIPKYEKMVRERNQRNQQRATGVTKVNLADVRCYNCREYGHYQTSCPKEMKPKGACYRCGKVGHQLMNCPQRAVGAVNEEDEEEIGWSMKPQQLYK